MAGRQAHGRPLSAAKPKAKQNAKAKKRTMDAFAIASHENPDRIKVKKSRLGAKEGGNRPGKRRRDEDDDEDDDEEEEETSSKKQKKGPEKGRFDELDLDEGSDSEGNEWKLGQVDSDDDSDLDSEEAFGESDEERFEGYAFSGSSDKKSKKNKKQTGGGNLNLDEDEEEESDSELEEGDMGEGAVDLADMLNSSSDEEEEPATKSKQLKPKPKKTKEILDESVDEDMSSGSGSDEEMDDSDDDSSASSASEDDDSANPHKIAALHSIIANLTQEDAAATQGVVRRRAGLSLSEPTNQLSTSIASGGKGKKAKAPLAVPLERRQQDRLDRSAAYDKSKETLGRWTDTVKHNREAEHLMFPLPDQDTETAKNNKQLVPTNQSKPFNDLEATIQSILEESGLATVNGKDDEDHIREFEELETNKLSLEEVKARRDQLRMARDLLFREEAKSKRIKKIKSKSYRKVHRKQREREERKNQEALAEGGFEPSEDELDAQDRRRAEERMGGKHRNSKWAKAMKESGRTAWDGDVMSGVTEMARKDEELRKRVEGRVVRKEFDGDSDASMSDSDDVSDLDDEADQKRLLRQLNKIGGDEILDDSAPGARLANMKFMQKAEAARKQANNAMVEEVRKELAGEDSESEEETDIGRRLFGPGSVAQKKPKPKSKDDFEEGENSDGEANFQGFDDEPKAAPSRLKELVKPSHLSSVTETEAKRRRHKKNSEIEVNIDLSQTLTAAQPKPKKLVKKIQTLDAGEESSDSENEVRLPFAIKDQDLIKRAFAGADVVGEFDLEKRQTIEDEDEKVVDNTLPGWGSWVGSGVSKKDKQRNKGRFLTKTKGVKASDRKDAKLEKVIINEKKVKKVTFVSLGFERNC